MEKYYPKSSSSGSFNINDPNSLLRPSIIPLTNLNYDTLNIDFSQSGYDQIQQSGGQVNGANRFFSQHDSYQSRSLNEQTFYHSRGDQDPARSGYFFESPSKLIPLKKHNEHYNNRQQPSVSLYTPKNLFQTRVFGPCKGQKDIRIKEWFQDLSLEEKSVVLTIVDKQLVQLIIDMYNVFKVNGNGRFLRDYPTQSCNNDDLIRLRPRCLLFKKPRCRMQELRNEQGYLAKIYKAEHELINHVRLLNLNTREKHNQERLVDLEGLRRSTKKELKKHKFTLSQCYDSITLDNSFYLNNNHFFEMMHQIRQKNSVFLGKELILSNDLAKLDSSVFYPPSEVDATTSMQDTSAKEKPSKFYGFYPSQGDAKFYPDPKNGYTLAECLMIIFEKAINVQYQDYLGRLNKKQCSFFFAEPKFPIFQHDQRLTHFWVGLSFRQKNDILKQMDAIEEQLKQEEHRLNYNKQKQYPRVEEMSEDEEVSSRERHKSKFFKTKTFKNSDDEDDDFDNQFASDEDLEAQRHRVKCLDGRVELAFGDIKSRIKRNETIAMRHEDEIGKDELREQNKYMFQKTNIITGGVACHTELLAFTFIKSLSTKASLESTTKRSDFEAEFRDRFYLKLIEIQQNSVFQALEDLVHHQDVPSLWQQKLDKERQDDERRSLLTGEVLDNKYKDDLQQIIPQGQSQRDPQKKKKRKNKKRKNKKTDVINETQPVLVIMKPLFEEVSSPKLGKMEDVLEDDDDGPSTDRAKNQHKIEEAKVDEIEAIQLDQIEIQVDQTEKTEFKIVGVETNIELEARKINNFITEKSVSDDLKVQVLEDRDARSEQEETQSLTQDITADIFHKIIAAVEEKPVQSKEHKKQKRKAQKKVKKNQNSNKNTKIEDKRLESPIPTKYQGSQLKLEVYPPTSSGKKQKKQVEFIIQREPGLEEEEIRIPKRGSSRGSSVGTEDVIHMHTISSLGELFPQEYKNPSIDTKIKIHEITTFSSSSRSPERETIKQPSKPQQPLEQMTNQNKQGKQSQGQKKGRFEKVFNDMQITKEEQEMIKQEDRIITKPKQEDNRVVNSMKSPQMQPKTKVYKQKRQVVHQKEFESYDAMFKTAYYGYLKETKQVQESLQDEVTSKNNSRGCEQPQITQKTAKPLKESRDLQERGASVNPNMLQKVTDPQGTQKRISEINQNVSSIPLNNNQRKVKTKILKSNNNPLISEKSKTTQQPLLQPTPNEHRSQTPNVEQVGEPLTVNINHHIQKTQHHNQHRKSHNANTNQKNKNQLNGKKKQSQASFNAQMEQALSFNHQQMPMQALYHPSPHFAPQVPSHIMMPCPQMFNPMLHPGFQQHPPAQIFGMHQSPSPMGYPGMHFMVPPQVHYQQFVLPKITQETQTEPGINEETKINDQSPLLHDHQSPQTMINQIQNFNVQIFQQPYAPLPQPYMSPYPQHNYSASQIMMHQASMFNQPFTNFQASAKRRVTHQSLEQYRTQTKEEVFFQRFDREIYKLQFEQQMKLAETESERQLAFRHIEQCVKEAYQEFSDLKVQVYGSMATGLAIDSSDMDVLVSGVFHKDKGVIDRFTLIEQMKRLHRQLNQLFCLESNSIIETATVPVIKIIVDMQKIREQSKSEPPREIQEDMKLLKIDITFNDQEQDDLPSSAQPVHMGIKCCEFIKDKLLEYRELTPLTLLLKKFLALRDLNSPFLGGLSSYGLIILIIAFLNQDLPQTYDAETEQLSPARIFTQFLLFYGRLFNPKLQIINEYQQVIPQFNFSSALIIVDPLNLENNIGKSSYNFDQIRNEFANAHDKILSEFNQFIESSEEKKEEGPKLHILSKVLFGDYNHQALDDSQPR